ncbi:hypothetical protein FACS189490_07720 [Clostridia bacterium]|nr:hypothetical protein FACS189490_07720 [Clostridia bacterium]
MLLTSIKNKLNFKKTNNKGFSLVELIIVVAIMAILIAILAPQFLKYVERSRTAKDEANADEFLRASQIAVADNDASAIGDFDVTLAKTTGIVTIKADNNDDLQIVLNEFNASFGWDLKETTNASKSTTEEQTGKYKPVSKAHKAQSYVVRVRFDRVTPGDTTTDYSGNGKVSIIGTWE